MASHLKTTWQIAPTKPQAILLATQLKFVKKIVDGCPAGQGNPFGQSKRSFVVLHNIDLWHNINSGMMGFSEHVLRDPAKRLQFNYRPAGNVGMPINPNNHSIYLPQLARLLGDGELRAANPDEQLTYTTIHGDDTQIEPPYPHLASFITIAVKPTDQTWWLTAYCPLVLPKKLQALHK